MTKIEAESIVQAIAYLIEAKKDNVPESRAVREAKDDLIALFMTAGHVSEHVAQSAQALQRIARKLEDGITTYDGGKA